MKKRAAFFIAAAMILSLFPVTALSASHDVADGQTLDISTGELTWTADGTHITTYSIAAGDTVSVAADAAATIKGSKNVSISCGVRVNLTLDNVNIDLSSAGGAAALGFVDDGSGGANYLKISGDTVLKSGSENAGINAAGSTVLNIEADNGVSLTANGGSGASGIGGSYDETGGKISISGGVIIANGGDGGAGIGGGGLGNGGKIVISGGTVTAQGGLYAAGVGGGSSGLGGETTITGTADVTANGGENAAGIGGGGVALGAGSGGKIEIDSGNVAAQGGLNGAGIGGGRSCIGGEITISGTASIVTQGGDGGAGIGGGYEGDGGDISVAGSAIVNTMGGDGGAGIGGGSLGNGGKIVISGGTVTAQGGLYASGVGGGASKLGGETTITGTADVTAIGGDGGAGIGSGGVTIGAGSGGKIEIDSGKVTAQGGWYGAGIGGGLNCIGGEITISGTASIVTQGSGGGAGIGGGYGGDGGDIGVAGNAVINTAGADGGAGIGGGYEGEGGDIVLSGMADIRAIGGNASSDFVGGAGIGGGGNSSGGSIIITENVNVSATGGDYALGKGGAGIGGGGYGNGGTIEVNGGTVIAQGGSSGAGIGGGILGDGGNIVFSNSADVNATGGFYGAGIGGGLGRDGGLIIIEGGTILSLGGGMSSGIGGGYAGSGGNIAISGGFVFAEKGYSSDYDIGYDIGPGVESAGGKLTIEGEGAVLLRTDNCITPDTSHTYLSMTSVVDGKIHGIETPDGWKQASGYFVLYILEFDDNGGTGNGPSDIVQHIGTTVIMPAKEELTNGRLAMVQWNTDADGEGYGYFPGVEYTVKQDTVLYAIWSDRDVTSVLIDRDTLPMIHHNTDTLTASVDPNEATKTDVVWYSNDTGVATVDQSGKVTAVGVGNTSIVAWADGVRDICEVTVDKKPVGELTISSSSKYLEEGEKDWLSVTVSPYDATDTDVTWKSSNTSVVIVNSSGFIYAKGEGRATITASADGVSVTCSVKVFAAEDENEEPGAEDAGEPSSDSGETGDSDNDESDNNSSGNNGDDTEGEGSGTAGGGKERILVFYIETKLLPAGTDSIQLPDGSVIPLDGSGLIRIELSETEMDGETINLVALDDEGTPLGMLDANVASAQVIDMNKADKAKLPLYAILLIALLGAGMLGVSAAWLTISLRKKR